MKRAGGSDGRGRARSPHAVVAAAVVVAALTFVHSARAATHTIAVEGMAYAPASLVIERGDRIVWINKDPFPHTVTAADGKFDSGSIAAGGSWSYVATVPGRFDYDCAFHPGMKGRLEVR